MKTKETIVVDYAIECTYELTKNKSSFIDTDIISMYQL